MADLNDKSDFLQEKESEQLGEQAAGGQTSPRREEKTILNPADMRRLFALLKDTTGVDFSRYRGTTVNRRILRRLAFTRAASFGDYVTLLSGNSAERETLYQDLLINVTNFFRDPELFDALGRKMIPRLLANTAADDPVRIWSVGCSTGEEIYSLAMVFLEYFSAHQVDRKLQIFASDVDDQALRQARAGAYPEGIERQVSPERLDSFFTRTGSGYTIRKSVRNLCTFVHHDVTLDPPFSRIDLISCRNLLIYLNQNLQERVFHAFHYALRPTGYLILGSSETVQGFTGLFGAEDPRHNIFTREHASVYSPTFLASYSPMTLTDLHPEGSTAMKESKHNGGQDFDDAVNALILGRLSPAGVVVNKELDVLQFRGNVGAYLTPATGHARLTLSKMLSPELVPPIHAALMKADESRSSVTRTDLPFAVDGATRLIDITVSPVILPSGVTSCYLVLFRDREAAAPENQPGDGSDHTIRRELAEARQYLQKVIDEREATTEELKAANEDIQSANEELRSANEELETSKEELQSANEELTTVNEELGERNLQLQRLNADLNNLLTGVDMPILMLDRNLNLRRFTPASTKLFNLIPSDVGRPLTDVRHKLAIDNFENLLRDVLEKRTEMKREVRGQGGAWYYLHVKPFSSGSGDVSDGLILSFFDMDPIKKAEQALLDSEEKYRVLFERAADSIVLIDPETENYVDFSASAPEMLGYAPEEFSRISIRDLEAFPGVEKMSERIPRILSRGWDQFETKHPTKDGRALDIHVKACAVSIKGKKYIVSIRRDITDLKKMERELKASEEKYRHLIEGANSIILRWKPDGAITFINDFGRRFFGYSTEELVGKHVGLLVPKQDSTGQDLTALTRNIARNPGKFSQFINENVKKNGEPVWISWTNKAMKDGKGDVSEILAIGNDITQLKKTEKALQISENIVSGVNSVIVAVDRRGTVTFMNDYGLKFFGFTRAELIGRRAIGTIVPRLDSNGKRMSNLVKSLMNNFDGHAVNRNENIKKNGERVWISWSNRAIRDDKGRITGMLSVGNDITELKHTQQELARREESYRALAENAPDIIARVDRRLRLMYVNRAITRLTGKQPACYAGKRIIELPALRKQGEFLERHVRSVFRTGKPVRFELRFPPFSGGRAFEISAVPERSEGRRIESLITVAREVTESRRLMERLQEEKQKLEVLLKNAPVGIVLADKQARLLMANDMAASLYKRPLPLQKDYQSHAAMKFCYPDGKPYDPADLPLTRSALKGESFSNVDIRIVWPDRQQRDLLISSSPVRDAQGKIIGAVGVFRDVSDIRKAEEILKRDHITLAELVGAKTRELMKAHMELEHAKRLSDIGLLAATIAHEIRNPLAAIRTAAYNVRRKARNPMVEGNLSTIDRKVVESDQIIQNLLSFSRIKMPKLEPVKLQPVLEECMSAMEAKYPRWDVKIVSRLGVPDPVPADPVQLRVVFTNILDNAYQALAEKKGKISVTAKQEQGKAVIRIADTGVGIEPDDIAHIFEPFFTRKSKGVGLGLSVCRQIIKLHNGTIEAESSPGAGTAFAITLPLSK